MNNASTQPRHDNDSIFNNNDNNNNNNNNNPNKNNNQTPLTMPSPPQSRPTTPTKRLLNELHSYTTDPNKALLHLGPQSDTQILHWEAVMRGVEGTAYEGGLWKLDVKIPDNYPLAPPDVRFVTPICHPNINFKTGEICLSLLKSHWSPAYTITQTLSSIHQLLTDPEPESPLNVDIAGLLRAGDRVGAESLIRYFTGEFRWKS